MIDYISYILVDANTYPCPELNNGFGDTCS